MPVVKLRAYSGVVILASAVQIKDPDLLVDLLDGRWQYPDVLLDGSDAEQLCAWYAEEDLAVVTLTIEVTAEAPPDTRFVGIVNVEADGGLLALDWPSFAALCENAGEPPNDHEFVRLSVAPGRYACRVRQNSTPGAEEGSGWLMAYEVHLVPPTPADQEPLDDVPIIPPFEWVVPSSDPWPDPRAERQR